MKKFAIVLVAILVSLAVLPCYAEESATLIAPDSAVSSNVDTPVSSEDAKDAVDYDTVVDGSLSFDSGVTGEFQTTGTVGAPEMGGESEIAASEANSEFKFEPQNFVDNLTYMGIGMVGIFIVIGIIILATVLLNKLFKEKASKSE